MPLSSSQTEFAMRALDAFAIEVPSWGFANTGTRFGKFIQAGAATTTPEKIADAGQVHRFVGCCPTVAVHVLWDFAGGVADVDSVKTAAARYGVAIGAINPNVFQDQCYKHGSLGNPDPEVRRSGALTYSGLRRDPAGDRMPRSVAVVRGWNELSWFRLHSCTQEVVSRRTGRRFTHALHRANSGCWSSTSRSSPRSMRPTSPTGACRTCCRSPSGPRAKVLVDTGHHYQAQNIEQIVAWLLDEDMLGGFHFNDRRYADDDLTLGSIDPYQVFRIFHEICLFAWETREDARYRLHGGPEPQPEEQDRGDDPDGADGAGDVP